MTKIIPEQQARQGNRGRHTLIILIAGLLLTFAAWGGAEFYGETIDSSTPGADQPAGMSGNQPAASSKPANGGG